MTLGVVASGSPAEEAGLKSGEIVLSIDGVEVETGSGLESAIEAKKAGTALLLRVLSTGKERRVTVTLSERPKAQLAQQHAAPQLMLDTGGHMAKISGLAFTPDGNQLVSASQDKVIRIWDWQAGRTVRTIRGEASLGNEGRIYAMALSPDGRWLAAGGLLRDAREEKIPSIRLYDFDTGKLVALLKGHTKAVNGLAFSPNSKRLISGGYDKTAIIWDVESRKLVYLLEGHNYQINAVAFNRDGSQVATVGMALRIWNADGQLVSVLKGHSDWVTGVAFSPIDETIVTTSWDHTLKFWNTSQQVRSMDLDCGWALSYSRDGRYMMRVRSSRRWRNALHPATAMSALAMQ